MIFHVSIILKTLPNMKYPLLSFFLVCLSFSAFAQSLFDLQRSVVIQAETQTSPPEITLNWIEDDSATAYVVYRKTGDYQWGEVTTLAANTLTYTDTNIQPGLEYEYRIHKESDSYWGDGDGYILAGIEVEPKEQRGTVILVIANTHEATLETEIDQFVLDLENDGWLVKKLSVGENDPVPGIRNLIIQLYNEDQMDTKGVILLGNVPVPYSGYLNLDGHPEHTGAMPADVYYGEMDGTWTDNLVSTSESPVNGRNWNQPGDGKFDQSYIPSDIDLAVSRIDFSDLPIIPDSEENLLRKYLNKNHDYRNKNFEVKERALVENRLGALVEGFGQNGLKNFVQIFGQDSVIFGNYTSMVNGETYAMSYVATFAGYENLINVANTQDFVNDQYETIFTMMMGSYIFDYDTTNNIMRVALSEGKTLTNAWVGRPDWQIHHMATGHHIGYSALQTQNDSTYYDPSWFPNLWRLTTINLLGDMSLRAHVVYPPSGLNVSINEKEVSLDWTASSDPDVLGYHIYRRTDPTKHFKRVNLELITGTSFVDPCVLEPTEYQYMVRAVKLQETASGSYYNLSQGIRGAIIQTEDYRIVPSFTTSSNGLEVNFTNTSVNGTDYEWSFGATGTSTEENPSVTYPGSGLYNVTLFVSNDCEIVSVTQQVLVIATSNEDVITDYGIEVFPNPVTDDVLFIRSEKELPTSFVELYDASGRLVKEQNIQAGVTNLGIDVSSLSAGVYGLRIQDTWIKVVVE